MGPIGIFDSGIGGLTVARAACDLLPNENILYFEHDPSWKHELDEFITSIRQGVKIHNGNLNDALEVMKLMDTISANRIIT